MITHLGSPFPPQKTGTSDRKQVVMNMLSGQVTSLLARSLQLVYVESGQVCGKCPHLKDCWVVNSSPHSDQPLLPLNSGKLNLKTSNNLDLYNQNKAERVDLSRQLSIFGSCSCVCVPLL